MNQISRTRFYEGQYLGADDLTLLEEYPRVSDARHSLGAHTWGIAIGLDIVQRTLPSGEVENQLTPGYGWDGFGRPLVVLAPVKLSPQLFANFQGLTSSDGLLIKVWLRYAEREEQNPAPGFEVCGVADQHARVLETYAIEVGEPMSGSHDDLPSVAGSPLPALEARHAFNPKAPPLFDESVPFQDFPGDDRARWLMPVGYVRWLKLAGQPGRFAPRIDAGAGSTPRDSDAIRQFRQYIGVVAETLHAPGGVLRLRDRNMDPDPSKTFFHPPNIKNDPTNPNDLVWIEGSLRVQGDTRLAAGRLEWRTDQGSDEKTPTVLRRRGDEGKAPGEEGGRRLQAIIGRLGQTNPSRFAVGPANASGDLDGDIAERLTVLSNGNVGIGNEAPAATLHLKTSSVLEEGPGGGAVVWTNLGENAYFDGAWRRLDATRPGVNMHLSALGDGEEFRFLRVEADGSNRRNFAVLGTKQSFIREGVFGVRNANPVAQLHLKSQTVLDEGADGAGTWANIGQNAFFDGSWLRVDTARAGVNLRMSADSAGREYRFTMLAPDGTASEIASIGSQTSFIAQGRLGVGTSSPAATLDVSGRIMRHGQQFSYVYVLSHGSPLSVPWGTTDDWTAFASPHQLGEGSAIPFEGAIAMIQCSVNVETSSVFRVTALYRNASSDSLIPGTANVLLLPK